MLVSLPPIVEPSRETPVYGEFEAAGTPADLALSR